MVRTLGRVFIKEVKRMLRFADKNISKIKKPLKNESLDDPPGVFSERPEC